MAEKICRIPISKFGDECKLVWRPTKNGQFLVISTYHFKCERSRRGTLKTSKREAEGVVWKSIWSIKVIGKVKHLI